MRKEKKEEGDGGGERNLQALYKHVHAKRIELTKAHVLREDLEKKESSLKRFMVLTGREEDRAFAGRGSVAREDSLIEFSTCRSEMR